MPSETKIEENKNTETVIEENANNQVEENISEEVEKDSENSEPKKVTTDDDASKDEDNKDEDKDKDNKEDTEKTFETAKDSSAGKFDTLDLIQETAKLEAKIENLKGNSVDEAAFYKELNKHLTPEQMQLRFEDDQSDYILAVNKAKEKWVQENSVDTSEDEKHLEAARGKLTIAKAIDTVLKDPDYKDFNFIKLQDFYTNDLTKKEQMEIDKGSTKDNLPDHFKKIHNEYKKRNPKKVKNVEAPNIPDASKVSKSTIEDKKQIEQEEKDKKYMEKIGFRKL